MREWSRDYSKRNTALLRRFIRNGTLIVDTEQGIVYRRNGKAASIEINFWGYQRVRVQTQRKGKRKSTWFFVHKAVMISTGIRLRKHYEINHKDHSRQNNRLDNLEYIHRSLNLSLSRDRKSEAAF